MLKKVVLLAALVLCLMSLSPAYGYFITSQSDPVLSGATVQNFNAETIGTFTGGMIFPGQFVFTALDNHYRYQNTFSGSFNTSGVYLDNGEYGDVGFYNIHFGFGNASAFGFHWGASDSAGIWTLTAYDAANNVIESYSMPATNSSNAGDFFGIAAANMDHAILSNAGSYDWIMIDDFTVKLAAPLPGAVWLLGSGLLGLLGWRRKFLG
jgi:hypothetical protein